MSTIALIFFVNFPPPMRAEPERYAEMYEHLSLVAMLSSHMQRNPSIGKKSIKLQQMADKLRNYQENPTP